MKHLLLTFIFLTTTARADRLVAPPSQGLKFKPMAAAILPPVTPVPPLAAPNATTLPALVNPAAKPVKLAPEVLYQAPPNISQATAQTQPDLSQFLSKFGQPSTGMGGGGSAPRIRRATSSGDYAPTDSNGDDLGPIHFPGDGNVPVCNRQTPGLENLVISSGAGLAGHDCDDKSVTDRLTCMVCNLYFECGNEPTEGQIAVAQSVLTRVFSAHYPHTVCQVVYQTNGTTAQYSWTAEAKSHRLPAGAVLDRVIESAKTGLKKGPSCDTNYFAYNIIKNPRWAHDASCASTLHKIGNHAFCAINAESSLTVGQVAEDERRATVSRTPADAPSAAQ